MRSSSRVVPHSIAIHALQGLKPISVEGEEAREREYEQKREQERSLGEGTVDAPLDLGDDHAQSPPLAGKHKLYDAHGVPRRPGGPVGKQRARIASGGQRGAEAAGAGRRGAKSLVKDSGDVRGGDGAAAAAADMDELAAERSERTGLDRASGKSSVKTRPHYPFDRERSSLDATAAAKTKKANDGGASAAAGSGACSDASRRCKILSSNQLPPGWKMTRLEQPDKNVSFFCHLPYAAEILEPAAEGGAGTLVDRSTGDILPADGANLGAGRAGRGGLSDETFARR